MDDSSHSKHSMSVVETLTWGDSPAAHDDPQTIAAGDAQQRHNSAAAKPGSKVKVVPRTGNEVPYPNCLLVEPREHPQDRSILLATVDHFLAEQSDTGLPWTIHSLNPDPVPFQMAMELALTYAEENGVPVVLVNQDGMSSEAGKQQTDTTILDMSYHHKVGSMSGAGS